MIRALIGTSVVILLVGCGSAPAGGGAGGGANPGGAPVGDPSACEFTPSEDAHAAFTALDARHQELTGELEADLEGARTMEEQQEIYAAIATIDEACLAALATIAFPSQANASLGQTQGALEDLAASRRAAAEAATDEEFEAALVAEGDALRDWQMWRNLLLSAIPH